jgi:PAS domain S-box-containing protein
MPVSLATRSLRAKIIILVVASVFATSALIGCLDYLSARQVAVDRGAERLASDTRYASATLTAAYQALKNDAAVVSRTPPVQGLIRSAVNGGFDAKEDSTTALWQRRLGQIFRSLMEVRPYYLQMLYIGFVDHGREIVRVKRELDGKLVVVGADGLQQHGDEAYFKEGAKTGKQSFSLSEVVYYGEQSRVDPDLVPTLRLMLPIFDEAGRRFGMIVIACDYERFIGSALANMRPGRDIYIADRQGNYIHRSRDGHVSTMQMAGYYTSAVPPFVKAFMSGTATNHQIDFGPLSGSLYTLQIVPGQPRADIGLFFLTPRDALMADAKLLGSRIALITSLLMVIAIALAAGFAEQITRPVAQVTAKIRSFAAGQTDAADLPVSSSDEIGELARAFCELILRLDAANLRRTQLSTQLDSFIANSVDGVIIIDESGLIQTINASALDILGYEEAELVGCNVSMLMPEPQRSAHDGHLARYRETGQKAYLGTIRDEKARCKDGRIIPISLAINEVMIGKSRIFAATIRDMTAIERAHYDVRRYAAELERSNQELDQFAYVASHDLKAPLRVIDNTSSWLEEDLEDKLTEKDRKHLGVLRSRVKRMDKLLDDLLDYSRVGRAKDDRQREIVSGSQLVDDILALLAPPSGFTIDVAPDFAAIQVARMPLQQVLYNLINNAIKHHDRDTGTIALGVERLPGRFRFTVRDDGPGVPTQYQKQIFEMFSTLKPRDEVEGSGMGLAIVKKTVEFFGGTIEIASGNERGAVFTFTWPGNEEVNIAGAAA